jgi:hypothetical protein
VFNKIPIELRKAIREDPETHDFVKRGVQIHHNEVEKVGFLGWLDEMCLDTLPPHHVTCHNHSYRCCCHEKHWNSLPHPSKSKESYLMMERVPITDLASWQEEEGDRHRVSYMSHAL